MSTVADEYEAQYKSKCAEAAEGVRMTLAAQLRKQGIKCGICLARPAQADPWSVAWVVQLRPAQRL
jgi:hypothetical protein